MLRLFYLQRIDHPILQCLSWGGRAKLFIFSWSLLDQKISHSHFHWIQILVCLPPPPPPGLRLGRICVEKKITIFSFCPTRTYPKIRMLKENKCFICFYFFSCKNVTKILKIVFLREKQNRRPVSLPYVLYIAQMHNYRRWARAFVKFTHYRCKAVDKRAHHTYRNSANFVNSFLK